MCSHNGGVEASTLRPSETSDSLAGDGERVPGVVLVFSGGGAQLSAMPLTDGALEVGRGENVSGRIDDGRISRRHARISYDGRRFMVADLGSQNGTFVDGEAIPTNTAKEVERVVRVGDSLLLPSRDIRPFERLGVRHVDGFLRGAAMQTLLEEVVRAAQLGVTLHIRGESGSGKEGLALAFHRGSGRGSGPFVPVNCAAIPPNIAERLLFGAKKGAYSGADADVPGYVQEANGGTLFLDEVAELDAAVQAKLLRTLESKEVMALGATKRVKVDVLLCSATNKDLRALVAAGKLREDLYFRIGRPEIVVPPLRNRPEEIAFLVADELQRAALALTPHAALVEQCLLRPWPGNVRELLAEVRSAAQVALGEGAQRVTVRHLAPSAGTLFASASGSSSAVTPPPSDSAVGRKPRVEDDWRRVEDTLRANGGNVTATARALGLHRTQLRRLLARHQIVTSDSDSDAGETDKSDGDSDVD
jgi:transcriptional regulator of acetoin/glycerol metabolism